MVERRLSSEEIAAIAEEAYLFSFPMLMGYRACFATFLMPALPSYRGPMNEMDGEPVTRDHNYKDVISPNADTPYSQAGLDLRAEPMVLTVPAVTDRYYVMQLGGAVVGYLWHFFRPAGAYLALIAQQHEPALARHGP